MSVDLDFSPLDALRGSHPPKQMPLTKPKPPIADDIQDSKREISQAVMSGAEPYPILLKAIQVIAALTDDRTFYSICRDTMQGKGMLDELPAEWEKESRERDLMRLEASKRVIDAAIAAHQDYEGLPGDTSQCEYMQRILQCFGDAYSFIEENKHPRTEEDWMRIGGSLSPYTDLFTAGLVKECLMELEREYQASKDI